MSDEISNDELGVLKSVDTPAKKAKKNSSLGGVLQFCSKVSLKKFENRVKARFSKIFDFESNLSAKTIKMKPVKGANESDKNRYMKWKRNYEKQFPTDNDD